MNFLIVFLSAGISVVLSGFLATWIASHLVAQEAAPVAGFSFILGGGSLVSINLPIELTEGLERHALASGMIAGAVLLWYLFFKRKGSLAVPEVSSSQEY